VTFVVTLMTRRLALRTAWAALPLSRTVADTVWPAGTVVVVPELLELLQLPEVPGGETTSVCAWGVVGMGSGDADVADRAGDELVGVTPRAR
jgi:hypothetical protein